jgi:threonylcarbamoyladenosine tRNA methylthiotransferase MtaB
MEIKNKKFTIISLGCRVNNVESAYIANKIQEEGGIYTDLINETKIAIINTCCVTQKAIKKSLLFIRRLNKQKNIELIIITGCFVQLNNCKIKYKKVGIIAGNNQKTKICSLIKKYNDKRIINVSKLTSRTKFENFNTNNFVHNTRAHIKIQDGCNNLCTYCIIPHVRGRQRSLKHEKIISHIKKLIKKKYKEIVLTGVNTSGYDDGKYNFYKLLKKIDTLKGNFRVRISSLEPFQINTTIIDLLTKNKKR